MLCLSSTAGKAYAPTPEDTITIQIGKTKKIIIWVDDKKDLVSLQLFDLNKMISDINKSVDSLDDANQVLIITDEDGDQYKIEADTSDIDDDWYKHDNDTSRQAENIELGVHFNRDGKDGKDKAKKDHFGTHHHFEFDLGMNNYLGGGNQFPTGTNAVRPWGSWFVGINSNWRSHIAGPLALQWGGGISWYNFKFEDKRTRLIKTPEEVVFSRDGSSEIDAYKSKLTASYLNLNLVPMLDFRYKTRYTRDENGQRKVIRDYKKDAFRIGLGGYAGYRIGSHTKYKFEEGRKTKREKDHDNFYLNNFRYGLRLQMGFKGVDMFANYDLNSLFSENQGPELYAISFGITF